MGGGAYPIDGAGAVGSSYPNAGTSQPRFDVRIDQETAGGGRITYGAGLVGSSGIIYTGIGPFGIQKGSYVGYVKVGYRREALRVNGFVNFTSAKAPSLLLIDPATQRPVQLSFSTQTYDVEVGDVLVRGKNQVLSVGGNLRRDSSNVSIAPMAPARTEFGAYIQDELLLKRVRLTLGGRLDHFGDQSRLTFSPRLAAIVTLMPRHSLRASYSRGYRSPPPVYNYIGVPLVSPTDLSFLGQFLPPEQRPLVADPFPLVVNLSGSRVPAGRVPRPRLIEESVIASELSYSAILARSTTIGVAAYLNHVAHGIALATLPVDADPYTEAAPPPGWQLPPSTLTLLAEAGVFLPRTAFSYENGVSRRQSGVEVSLDHRIKPTLSTFATFSWQATPVDSGRTTRRLPVSGGPPSMSRFNGGVNLSGARLLASASVNYVSRAFWNDVFLSSFAGYTAAHTSINGSFGVRWQDGKVTTLVKGTNLGNGNVQDHVFGDIIKRAVTAEVRFAY